MRKIRFRGVSIYTNNWVYGDCIHTTAGGKSLAISDDFGNLFPIYANSLGQITDFVDTKGVEIYEGDYVKVDSEDFPEPLLMNFKNGSFMIDDLPLNLFCNTPNTINGEITGTIYFFGNKTAEGN